MGVGGTVIGGSGIEGTVSGGVGMDCNCGIGFDLGQLIFLSAAAFPCTFLGRTDEAIG